jgi:hypothetical protein
MAQLHYRNLGESIKKRKQLFFLLLELSLPPQSSVSIVMVVSLPGPSVFLPSVWLPMLGGGAIPKKKNHNS